MIVAVPWRKNQDDAKMNGERLTGGVVMMDKDSFEKLTMEDHVPVPKRVRITREDLEVFGFTARCLGCMSLLKGTARQARTQKSVEDAGGNRTKAREGISGQSSRAENETNEVEPGRRTDGCANHNEFKQQRRGSKHRQLRRRHWIPQGGQQEDCRW